MQLKYIQQQQNKNIYKKSPTTTSKGNTKVAIIIITSLTEIETKKKQTKEYIY